jgi:hypothetical protein
MEAKVTRVCNGKNRKNGSAQPTGDGMGSPLMGTGAAELGGGFGEAVLEGLARGGRFDQALERAGDGLGLGFGLNPFFDDAFAREDVDEADVVDFDE